MNRSSPIQSWLLLSLLGCPVLADGPPPPLNPADPADPAFRDVRDRTPISFRESAAYGELLKRARDVPAAQLDAEARRDVLYADLATHPARYRGVPIRLQGTVRLVHALPEIPPPLVPSGRLYEAWAFTSDGRGYPTVLVFEDLPKGLPLGDNVQAVVVFRGFFFKLLAYRAGDRPRYAPLLVGRVEHVPNEKVSAIQPAITSGWVALPIAMLGAYALLRVILIWQRGLAPPGRDRPIGPPPNDMISPEELDGWLRSGDDGGHERPAGK